MEEIGDLVNNGSSNCSDRRNSVIGGDLAVKRVKKGTVTNRGNKIKRRICKDSFKKSMLMEAIQQRAKTSIQERQEIIIGVMSLVGKGR